MTMEEIYAIVLPRFAEVGIEDTLFNRILYLEGYRDGIEDSNLSSTERDLTLIIIDVEILDLMKRFEAVNFN